MTTQNLPSTKFSWQTRDFWKGLIMAVGTPLLYFLQEAIPGYPLHPMVQLGLSALVTYLIKNFFTDDVKVAQKTIAEAKEKQIENTLNS